MDKEALRQRMQTIRKSLPPSEVEEKSQSILDRLFSSSYYKNAGIVMTYMSFRGEVNTRPLMERAFSDGKQVCVPLCMPVEKQLLVCEIYTIADLIPGTLGILEPSPDGLRPLLSTAPDLIVIPGLAFDRQGNRLGHGAGYYDRFLPVTRRETVKIALAYDFQIVSHIPFEIHDVPMDMIFTESEIIKRKPK